MTNHGGYPQCACPDCNPRRSYWALADVRKYEDGKSYERGDVDWRERSVPPYPSTPEQRAMRLVVSKTEPKERKTKQLVTYEGHEVEVETLVKRTAKGAINTQSTLGKVVALALDKGCSVRAWASEVASGIQGAHHGLRFSVTGTTVFLNGKIAPVKDLLVRLEEIKETI